MQINSQEWNVFTHKLNWLIEPRIWEKRRCTKKVAADPLLGYFYWTTVRIHGQKLYFRIAAVTRTHEDTFSGYTYIFCSPYFARKNWYLWLNQDCKLSFVLSSQIQIEKSEIQIKIQKNMTNLASSVTHFETYLSRHGNLEEKWDPWKQKI